MSQAEAVRFAFPPSLIGHADVARLLRELETLDNDLGSQRARNRGTNAGYRLPNTSPALSDMLALNKIDIANDRARMDLRTQLRKLKDHAPVLHLTFAAETDPEALQQIVEWIRKELHPLALITVGLQPSLIGGVYVRTPNHVHDFSVRAHMQNGRGIIVRAIDALVGAQA